jgi:hypothetical protein
MTCSQAISDRRVHRGYEWLLLTGSIRPFPKLSCTPVFRRRWSSVYAALDDGRQNTDWLRRYLAQQLPSAPILVFALDGTSWPRPHAPTLPNRQYVYQPNAAVAGGTVVVGQAYSIFCARYATNAQREA